MIRPHLMRRLLHAAGLCAFFLFAVFPVYWMVVTSLTPEKNLFVWPLRYFPSAPTLEHYIAALLRTDIPRFFTNSLTVASLASGIVALAYSDHALDAPLASTVRTV